MHEGLKNNVFFLFVDGTSVTKHPQSLNVCWGRISEIRDSYMVHDYPFPGSCAPSRLPLVGPKNPPSWSGGFSSNFTYIVTESKCVGNRRVSKCAYNGDLSGEGSSSNTTLLILIFT